MWVMIKLWQRHMADWLATRLKQGTLDYTTLSECGSEFKAEEVALIADNRFAIREARLHEQAVVCCE